MDEIGLVMVLPQNNGKRREDERVDVVERSEMVEVEVGSQNTRNERITHVVVNSPSVLEEAASADARQEAELNIGIPPHTAEFLLQCEDALVVLVGQP